MTKQYVLFPSVPTPNGGLHLGHIGGPYLAADICARVLRMHGHDATIMCGTDSYDSYVSGRAEQEGTTETLIANQFHDCIIADLKAMNIDIKTFANPLSDRSYDEIHYTILNDLLRTGAAKLKTEFMPWDTEKKKFISGYALKGNCPHCEAIVSGYFCEKCGAHFKPEDMRNKQVAHEKQVDNLFLDIPEYPPLRLTTQAHWGLPYTKQQVLFNYGFIYAYFLWLGKIGLNTNVFDYHSEVVTISSFGIDNASVFKSSIQGMAKALGLKPVDHYLINHFYYLEGRKFSTSKNHAIWVRDIVNQHLDQDIIRLYLATINVKENIGNVTQHDLLRFYKKTKQWIELKVLKVIPKLNAQKLADRTRQHEFELFNHLIAQQQAVLTPEHFYPHLAITYLNTCVTAGDSLSINSGSYFWWLKALCILSHPFMPTLSKKIWGLLGFSGEPNYKDNDVITSACA